ncbi:MAG TPA: cytidine deaminase [Anaerolineaceae bacterium]|jgi:cytidine deaminase|nr:cytidine deaminase [Anaerolineaceae bacterium]HQM54134.1 cytidine deaminase [Anaerolineaceae bacterium]HRS73999.1 cytidine deaminase [Anaerolineaceae bacterium]HRT91953.1 cytidine deaminase [Anaerolineaceae bacterium]HUM62495.1 cytidine deaminase [Anaerolineaceae bacterium]
MKTTTQIDGEMLEKLIETARNARNWAYAPYSHYAVGAALLTASGKIYDGVNIENAAFPAGICAERVAMFKAVSEGERDFTFLVVMTDNGGSPCGSCRQVMAEFGLSTRVLIVDTNGKTHIDTTVEGLLPWAFRPEDLL